MSSPSTTEGLTPINLEKWKKLPLILIVAGGILALVGAFGKIEGANGESHIGWRSLEFGFAWLQAFMFFLSLCLGGLFLTLVHHLFDAAWSVPIRRICEHLAWLAPVMLVLFIPIFIFAPQMYPWMGMELGREAVDHALHAKYPLFTIPSFYIVSAVCFASWIFFANRLRHWSLQQDKTGDARCTHIMRRYAAVGVFVFALSLTFGVIMWVKALQHQWFSTMYGVYYFAGSVWTTLATVYVLTALLKRQGPLRELMREKQFYFLGTLFFAFTVFYAYITFSQYFIIWNANLPEETFWFKVREVGSWWQIGLIIIFGHFFIPFLTMLRIDVKLSWTVMIPLCAWAWLMHFCDMSFNVMPVHRPDGFILGVSDIGAFAFMAGVLATVFIKYLNAHPIYPLKDPRLREALDMCPVEMGKAEGAKS